MLSPTEILILIACPLNRSFDDTVFFGVRCGDYLLSHTNFAAVHASANRYCHYAPAQLYYAMYYDSYYAPYYADYYVRYYGQLVPSVTTL